VRLECGEGEEGGNSYAVKFKKTQEGSKEGTADMWPRRGGAVDREWTRQWIGSPLQTVHKRNAKRFEVGRCNSTDVANDSYACCTVKIGVIGGGTWNWPTG
jgi:hypothetical protein